VAFPCCRLRNSQVPDTGLKPLLGFCALSIHPQKHYRYISTRNLTVAIKIAKQIIAEVAELQK
jgi:hypothetical protein